MKTIVLLTVKCCLVQIKRIYLSHKLVRGLFSQCRLPLNPMLSLITHCVAQPRQTTKEEVLEKHGILFFFFFF